MRRKTVGERAGSRSSSTCDFARYHVQLRRYLEHFRRDQMKLFLYEDFAADPVRVTQEIFRFIGVDDAFVPDVSARANAGGIPKSEWWQSVVMRPNPASKLFGSLLPPEARRRVRDALSAHQHAARGDAGRGAAHAARGTARRHRRRSRS